jgi:CelD/BcsL family acetyltransferase involved in cellulose biosynthesis
VNLEILHGRSGLQTVEEEWSNLTAKIATSALAQMPEYYLAYANAFEFPDRELIIATVRNSDGRVIAIAPLCFAQKKKFGLSINYVRFPDIPVPLRDVLFDTSLPDDEILGFLLGSLGKEIGENWVYMQFRKVLGDSALIPNKDGNPKLRRLIQPAGYSHVLDVSKPGYIEDVLNSHARNNLKRNQKKMEKLGRFEFRTISEFPDLDVAYEHFLTTEAAGWKSVRGGKRAIKLHADQTRFYYDLMRRLSRTKRCEIHLLYLNGQPVASDYCIISGETSYSVKHGYDETYSRFAPGNLLRAYAINYYGNSDRIRQIDLISGQDWHKIWRPERRPIFDIKVFSQNSRGKILYYLAKTKKIRNTKNNF